MNNYITVTSGFILPKNSYYGPINSNESLLSQFLNRSSSSTVDTLIKHFKENGIHSSDTVNSAYFNYAEKKDFNSFIKLVDITYDILNNVDLLAFFRLQACNPNLSQISFKFCLDIISNIDNFNHFEYNAIPYNIRFSINNNLSTLEMSDNVKKIEHLFTKDGLPVTWENFLSKLSKNKDAFVMFYKYIFTDVY